jgi:helix-turn-helix family protein
MEDILQNINNQIRDLRIAKKITQQELAEKTNLSVPYISQIENSHRSISLETFIKIVRALEISLSDFFIPYSVTHDTELIELLLEIQKYQQHKKIVQKILEILELSQEN